MWSTHSFVSVGMPLIILTWRYFCLGNVHTCVHASNKLLKAGSGTTADSCMGCNPALPTCFPGCQGLIDKLYSNCDKVCLPYGYYFDPQQELDGCWSENKPKVKIKVERCGCSAAFSQHFLPLNVFIFCSYASTQRQHQRSARQSACRSEYDRNGCDEDYRRSNEQVTKQWSWL